MSRGSAGAALALLLGLAAGCAGPTVYGNGIRHCYLCAVRVARVNGYEVREQDFHPNSGELIAARSMPDIHETEIKRSWFRKQREVFKNLWEHGKFERWEADVATERVRTEERMRLKFSARATGPLGWLGVTRKDKTKVKVAADFTEYGREDWVITRRDLDPATHDRLKRQLRDCLGLAAPTAYTRAAASGTPVPAASGSASPVSASLPATATSGAPVVPVPAAAPAASATGMFAPEGVPAAAAASATVPSSPEMAVAPATAPATAASSTLVAAGAPAPAPAPIVRVTKLSADKIAGMLTQGKEAYEGGKYREAIPFLERVTAADPESAEALVYLGASYYQEKQLDDAIRTYEAYVLLAPDDLRSKSFLEELRREKSGAP